MSIGKDEFNERLTSLAERKWRIRHDHQLQLMGTRCVGTAGMSEVVVDGVLLHEEFCHKTLG